MVGEGEFDKQYTDVVEDNTRELSLLLDPQWRKMSKFLITVSLHEGSALSPYLTNICIVDASYTHPERNRSTSSGTAFRGIPCSNT